jgi:23S rRNA (uracil1939-C5)-methyltransferase
LRGDALEAPPHAISRGARMTALPHFNAAAPALADEVVHCEHADRCGGCPFIALSYREQLAEKRGRVIRAMARYPALAQTAVEPVEPATTIVSYRTRAKLMVARGARVGLFAKGGGHEVVDIPNCRVLSPSLARVAAHLRSRIAESERLSGPLAPFDPSGCGSLRAVDLREVMGELPGLLVTFVVERARVTDMTLLRQAATELVRDLPEVLGVAANFHVGETPQVLGGETTVLAGVAAAPDRIGASMHFATFGSFVQVHREQASRVHALLVGALGLLRPEPRPARVVDLYGGSGAISLGLAAAGASVHLVEAFGPAVTQANAGAKAQGLDVHAEKADAAAALAVLAASPGRFDAVVLNPPRRGASPAAREGIARLEPQIVAYVSCDPETLARDIEHLTRLGYSVVSEQPIDMIPLTEEIETVTVLRRGATPAPRVLYENADVVIVEKGPHEPTTPQGEYASSLLARARLLPGAESCVPVHRLDVGTSGLVMFARRPDRVAKWASALSAASTRKIYIAAVRGVTPGKGATSRDLPEGGKLHRARTRYRRLAIASGQSLLRVVPDEGRTHQIRRHLSAIGHPVIGDDRYGHAPTNRYFAEKYALDRAFLHCTRLEIDHPDTGARLVVEAPLAGDLRAVLERISGAGTLRFLDHKNALGGRELPGASTGGET